MSDADPGLMTIFAEALERTDPTARAAYLDAACGDDAARRRRVEALLAAHDGAGRFLEGDSAGTSEPISPETLKRTPAPVTETRLPSELATEEHRSDATMSIAGVPQADRTGGSGAGQVIAGRYTLREVLGEGGMGTVYRADQTEPVKRQVALKLIKVGMDSRAVLARFDAERQALALMDHPNIARVYDGGTTATGQPFFVMELVNGVPITSYCDHRRLSVQARLELFVAVCQAVQHAHQKGIIHRDLKPSNVMVTEVDGRPTPKVIDFGVAKATEFNLTDLSLADTGAIVGTPTYMSPEQADPTSMDIDTRTDIYALGVILYELLAGSTPIDANQFKRGALLEMLRMVREIDPPQPSTKVSASDALPSIAASRGIEPSQLKQLLRGDLDWIVMRALDKDRTRRYETANGFAADVLRHLASEPVLAAPPSLAYRTRKFVRKHRAAVLTAVTCAMLLLVGAAASTWQAVRATLAEARAEDNALRARREEKNARDAQATAERQRDETRRGSYSLLINLADREWHNNKVGLAEGLLDKSPPDLRHWEWGYLKHLCHLDELTIRGDGYVFGVAYSPDGKRLASAGSLAKVWDAGTGQALFALNGHTPMYASTSVAFSPDGKRIATAGLDRTVRVWEADTGRELHVLGGHSSGVRGVAFSPDGQLLASASISKNVKIWDAATGKERRTLKGTALGASSVAFSPDSKRVGAGSWDNSVTVWEVATGRELLAYRGHSSQVDCLAFSPDGKTIASGGADRSVKVWDATTGRELTTLHGHADRVTRLAFRPDGRSIASASADRTVKIWDTVTGQELLTLRGHSDEVRAVAFRPDGRQLASAGHDRTIKFWDTTFTRDCLALPGHRYPVTSLAFSPDGKRLASAGAFVRPTNDGQWGSWGDLRVCEAETGRLLLKLEGHSAVAFSPDGRRLAAVSNNKDVTIFDGHTGLKINSLTGHTATVSGVAFSPDGCRVASAAYDRTVKLWDATTGRELLTMSGHTFKAEAVAFDPTGNQLASVGMDGTVRVWDAVTGREIRVLRWDGGRFDIMEMSPHALAYSPDGKLLATAGWDDTVRVWDAATGVERFGLRGHTKFVSGVAFSDDGKRILTSSHDETVKVWDAATGQSFVTLQAHINGSMGLAIDPTSTLLASGGRDTWIRVWPAEPLSTEFRAASRAASARSPSRSETSS